MSKTTPMDVDNQKGDASEAQLNSIVDKKKTFTVNYGKLFEMEWFQLFRSFEITCYPSSNRIGRHPTNKGICYEVGV